MWRLCQLGLASAFRATSWVTATQVVRPAHPLVNKGPTGFRVTRSNLCVKGSDCRWWLASRCASARSTGAAERSRSNVCETRRQLRHNETLLSRSRQCWCSNAGALGCKKPPTSVVCPPFGPRDPKLLSTPQLVHGAMCVSTSDSTKAVPGIQEALRSSVVQPA